MTKRRASAVHVGVALPMLMMSSHWRKTVYVIEERATKKFTLTPFDKDLDLTKFRMVSEVKRNHDYAGFVYNDVWGGTWWQSSEAVNISGNWERLL